MDVALTTLSPPFVGCLSNVSAIGVCQLSFMSYLIITVPYTLTIRFGLGILSGSVHSHVSVSLLGRGKIVTPNRCFIDITMGGGRVDGKRGVG